jgi:hypothetical protein
MPYLNSNKLVKKLLASGKIKLFPKQGESGISDIMIPTKNYLTFDAKTVEKHD